MQTMFRNWWPGKKLFLGMCSSRRTPVDGSKCLLIGWGTRTLLIWFVMSCLVSGPLESQLQIMWWRAGFPSINWVVCLSRWIHLPGKLSRCCAKIGEGLYFGLFLSSTCSLPSSWSSPHSAWEQPRWKQHSGEWLTGVSRGLSRPAWRISSLFWGWRTNGQLSQSAAFTLR